MKQPRVLILFLPWRRWWGSGQSRPGMLSFSAHCPCRPSAVSKWECAWRPLTARSGLGAGAVISTVRFSFIMLSMIRKNWSHSPESNRCQRSVISMCGSVIRPLILGKLWVQSSTQNLSLNWQQPPCLLPFGFLSFLHHKVKWSFSSFSKSL